MKIIKFNAIWCSGCIVMKKIMKEIEEEYKNIEIGSYVYTTSYNEKIPAGILVGKVSSVEKDSYDLAKIIQITSDVDFNNIRYVKVLIKGEKNDN